jgi:hypothetical protein
VNGTNKKCCPLPSPGTHEVYSIDAGVGACTKSCKPGYVFNTDNTRCISQTFCPPYINKNTTENQYYIKYYRVDGGIVKGTDSCPEDVVEPPIDDPRCKIDYSASIRYCCKEDGFEYDTTERECVQECDDFTNTLIEYKDTENNDNKVQILKTGTTKKNYFSVDTKEVDCKSPTFSNCSAYGDNYRDITNTFFNPSVIDSGSGFEAEQEGTPSSQFTLSHDGITYLVDRGQSIGGISGGIMAGTTTPIGVTNTRICSTVMKKCYRNLSGLQVGSLPRFDNGNYYVLENVVAVCTPGQQCESSSDYNSCPTWLLPENDIEITNASSCLGQDVTGPITCATGIDLNKLDEDAIGFDIVKCDTDNRYIGSSKRCVNSSICQPRWEKQIGVNLNLYDVDTYTLPSPQPGRDPSGYCVPEEQTIEEALLLESVPSDLKTNCTEIRDTSSGTINEYKCCSDNTKGKPYKAIDGTYTCDKVWTNKFNIIDYAGYEDESIVTKTLITSDLANSMGIPDGKIPS